MRQVLFKPNFDDWRSEARILLNDNIPPHQILWKSSEDEQESLLNLDFLSEDNKVELNSQNSLSAKKNVFKIPQNFLSHAKDVALHRSSDRWSLLYRIFWRIKNENSNLIHISVDSDMIQFNSMYRSVKRDMHKMKAFVRFKEVKNEDGEIRYVAWHAPDHLIVKKCANFFVRRFNGMKWSILTTDESAHWDGNELTFSPGLPQSAAPQMDDMEELWKTYYASIFNPARIKVRAMKKEMPVRHWKTLPETELISNLIRESPQRIQSFYQNQPISAEKWLPKNTVKLEELKQAASTCQGCGLCQLGTQTVFGEGPEDAKIMFVGEQPGDQEDLEGRPFVGPAGQLLNQALEKLHLERSEFYFTNAVKHFKWKPGVRKGFRFHQTPNASEIAACNPWLRAEIKVIQPQILVCLGATAAQSIMGKVVKLADVRGSFFQTAYCQNTFVTIHPSAILRMTDPEQKQMEFENFLSDLKKIKPI